MSRSLNQILARIFPEGTVLGISTHHFNKKKQRNVQSSDDRMARDFLLTYEDKLDEEVPTAARHVHSALRDFVTAVWVVAAFTFSLRPPKGADDKGLRRFASKRDRFYTNLWKALIIGLWQVHRAIANGDGQLRNLNRGVRASESVEEAFERHMDAYVDGRIAAGDQVLARLKSIAAAVSTPELKVRPLTVVAGAFERPNDAAKRLLTEVMLHENPDTRATGLLRRDALVDAGAMSKTEANKVYKEAKAERKRIEERRAAAAEAKRKAAEEAAAKQAEEQARKAEERRAAAAEAAAKRAESADADADSGSSFEDLGLDVSALEAKGIKVTDKAKKKAKAS